MLAKTRQANWQLGEEGNTSEYVRRKLSTNEAKRTMHYKEIVVDRLEYVVLGVALLGHSGRGRLGRVHITKTPSENTYV